MDRRDVRVTDHGNGQIIVVKMSPVIFSANEISMFMWVCGLLISCLKKMLWWAVCAKRPYVRQTHLTVRRRSVHAFLALMYLQVGFCEQLQN